MDSWEFSVNGVPVRGPFLHFIPRKGTGSMTTATMTVNAPSAATERGFIKALAWKASETARKAGGWVRDMSDRTGVTKVASFVRRYLSKAFSIVRTIIKGAGAIPLAILAATSRTGQKVIKQSASWLWGIGSWVGRKITDSLDWVLRRFGKVGNSLADRCEAGLGKVQSFVKGNLRKFAAVAQPYTSPERLYMKGAKVASYVMVASGLIGTFISGIWVVPAFLVAGAFGLAMSPTVRRNVLVNRLLGALETDVKAKGRKKITLEMEQMVVDYGPDMDTWTTAARADYAVRQAIYKALDDEKEPFKGLSGNQRKRAEKWLHVYEQDVARLVDETVAAAGGEVTIDKDGHVIIEGALA